MIYYFLAMICISTSICYSLEIKELDKAEVFETPAYKRKLAKDDLISITKNKAVECGIAPELLCAIVETESGWNPVVMRYEPSYYNLLLEHLNKKKQLSADEVYLRSTSFGLLQIMGESMRELGFKGTSLVELCAAELNLDWGCKLINKKLREADGNIEHMLLKWNGGLNPHYPQLVMQKIEKYKDVKSDPLTH